MAAGDYRAFKRKLVADALARHGIDAPVEETAEVPPYSRRRAVFKIARKDDTAVGFHAQKSHTVVDMHECLVLAPRLFASVAVLRAIAADLLPANGHAEVHATLADNGLDLSFRASIGLTPARAALLGKAAPKLGAIRILWNGALAYESAPPRVAFGKAEALLPPETFLQPTHEGEAILRARVLQTLNGAKSVADLFAGSGTFALALAERMRVHAVEREGEMLEALAAAARRAQGLKPVTTEKRDLFKRPLSPAELSRFDAVVLDPPRAGAMAQAEVLAASNVARIAYVSCDAASFARDAAVIVRGGYRLAAVLPVDQFLWSGHIELVASFDRGK
jgi:23S rRNA (uracil1939-C5)-methyltransferase